MAASKDFAVLDLQNESGDLGMDLQFQDFGDIRTQPAGVGNSQHEQTIHFTDFPDTAEDDQENDKLMGEGEAVDPMSLKAGASFWTFEFYQQFFNVESKQVGDRILWSMVPKPGVNYLQSYIRPNPDLYGPFWISVTLAFTTAITGNLANYLATKPGERHVWKYDFNKVTLAASAIFTYAWLIPLGVWGLVLWRGSRAKITLLELLCIYGYSLAIFVPVSILWMVPQPWFKYCLAIVAPVLSGSVLVRTIWPSLSHDNKQVALGIVAFILLLHATLALGFMLYFFSAPADEVIKTDVDGGPDITPVPKPDDAKGQTEAGQDDSKVEAASKEEDKDPGDAAKDVAAPTGTKAVRNVPPPSPEKETVVTPVKKPEATPVKKPEGTPVKKPEATPVKKPEATPVKKPEGTPVKKPEATPVKKIVVTLKPQVVPKADNITSNTVTA